jgi:ankyrin repeat protein
MNEVQCPSIVGFTLESLITPCNENQLQMSIAQLDLLFKLYHYCQDYPSFCEVPFPRLLPQAALDTALLVYMKLPKSHPEVRDSLVRWGANVNFQHSYSVSPSPLATAVRANNLDNVRWLLSVNADVNLVTDGWTPLMRACYLGHTDIAKYLLQHGADVNVVGRDLESVTAVTSALLAPEATNFELIGYLLDHGARLGETLDGVEDTVLHRVVRAGKVEAVRFLLERGAVVHPMLVQPENIKWETRVANDRREIGRLLRKHSAIDFRTGTWRAPQCLPYTLLPPVLSRKHLA